MILVMRCALHTNNALEIKKRLSLQNKRPIHMSFLLIRQPLFMLHCTMPEITVIVKYARSQFIHSL